MSKKSKLVDRFLLIPKDFTWEELVEVLSLYGFTEQNSGKTSGSRRKFVDDSKNIISFLHKPHSGNIVKEYALKDVIAYLKEKGKINDE